MISRGLRDRLIWIAMNGAVFFGVAWLVSTFTTSATISACVAIGVTAPISPIICLSINQQRWPVPAIVGLTALAIGILSLIAGTIYYLRRVAP